MGTEIAAIKIAKPKGKLETGLKDASSRDWYFRQEDVPATGKIFPEMIPGLMQAKEKGAICRSSQMNDAYLERPGLVIQSRDLRYEDKIRALEGWGLRRKYQF